MHKMSTEFFINETELSCQCTGLSTLIYTITYFTVNRFGHGNTLFIAVLKSNKCDMTTANAI